MHIVRMFAINLSRSCVQFRSAFRDRTKISPQTFILGIKTGPVLTNYYYFVAKIKIHCCNIHITSLTLLRVT